MNLIPTPLSASEACQGEGWGENFPRYNPPIAPVIGGLIYMSVSFDRAASYYDETRGFPSGVETHVGALFAQAGGLTQSSRVIEIGIGTGRIALPLAPHVGAYYGVDISTAMMARLRSKPSGESIHLVQGDASKLPFPTAAFDAVIATHVFHLVSDVPAVLAEVARALRPGAMLLHGWNTGIRDALQEEWNRVARVNEEAMRRRTLLIDMGWTPVGDEHVHRFAITRAPQEMVDMIKRRSWSGCWQMSDDEINGLVDHLQTYIAAHYTDPHTPIPHETGFSIQAYKPPVA
jgi:ubiquinone/menaquinone biosynthesis C-methylase UbiE